TSPVINLGAVATGVTLEFWRYLNSDQPPYMNSTIDVYNGVSWVNIFTLTQGMSINDAAWTKIQLDVSAYKNPNFRIRWGWSIGQVGVESESGWNVDDVRLLPPNCP